MKSQIYASFKQIHFYPCVRNDMGILYLGK